MAGKYKKCPRCELNYILVDEELCQVCKTELKLAPSEEEDDMELCTLCGKNLITVDQVMCDECARKRNIDDVVDELTDDEDGDSEGKDTVSEWDQQKEDDLGGIVGADDDVEVVSFSDLEDEEDEDDGYMDDGDDSSVDHFEDEEDDFNLDDIDDYDDDDDDDDDYDDDDDDDFLTIKKKSK